jgi:hypothetical protein
MVGCVLTSVRLSAPAASAAPASSAPAAVEMPPLGTSTPSPEDSSASRPRVCLVLSGGGARDRMQAAVRGSLACDARTAAAPKISRISACAGPARIRRASTAGARPQAAQRPLPSRPDVPGISRPLRSLSHTYIVSPDDPDVDKFLATLTELNHDSCAAGSGLHPCDRRSVWETGQPQRVSNLCGIARSLEWLPLHELPN